MALLLLATIFVDRAIAVLLLAASLAACSTTRRAPAPPPAAPPPEPATVSEEEEPPSEVEAARAAEEGIERVDVAGLTAAASEQAEVVAELPFASGDAALGEPARRTLDALIDQLRRRQEPYRLELQTDGESDLAGQRAQAIRAYLEQAPEIAASSIRILPAPAPRAGRTDRVLVILRQP